MRQLQSIDGPGTRSAEGSLSSLVDLTSRSSRGVRFESSTSSRRSDTRRRERIARPDGGKVHGAGRGRGRADRLDWFFDGAATMFWHIKLERNIVLGLDLRAEHEGYAHAEAEA